MATWVLFKKAAKFPEVINAYHAVGYGQGNGLTGNAKRSFYVAVKRALAAGAAWVRKPPTGAAVSVQDTQIDVTAIPGVRALRKDGKWTKYPN